jgi:hypothetical protein
MQSVKDSYTAKEAWLRSSPSKFFWRNRSMDHLRSVLAVAIRMQRNNDQTVKYPSGTAKRLCTLLRAVQASAGLSASTVVELAKFFLHRERV